MSNPNKLTFDTLIQEYNKVTEQISQIKLLSNNNKTNLNTIIIDEFKNYLLSKLTSNKNEIEQIYNNCKQTINNYNEISKNISITKEQKNRIILATKSLLFGCVQKMYNIATKHILLENKSKKIQTLNNIENTNITNTHSKLILLQLVSILHELLPPFKRKEVLEKLKTSKKKITAENMTHTINKIVTDWISSSNN